MSGVLWLWPDIELLAASRVLGVARGADAVLFTIRFGALLRGQASAFDLVPGLLLKYVLYYGRLRFIAPLVHLVRRKQLREFSLPLLFVAVYGLYIGYLGGDGLAFHRFVVFLTPLIYVLVAEGLREAFRWVGERGFSPTPARSVAATALFLTVTVLATGYRTGQVLLFPDSARWYEPQSELSFPVHEAGDVYLWFDNYFVDRLAIAARWLDEHAAPGSTVASTPAGAVGYYMDLQVIDMLGLNDLHIARSPATNVGAGRAGHEKGDGKYVLSRSPEYILLGNVAVLPRPLTEAEMPSKLVQRSEREIWAEPEFHLRYERVTVKLRDDGVFRYFTFYKRKDAVLASSPASARFSVRGAPASSTFGQ